MSRIWAEGLNHYTVVYGLNCRRLKDSVVGHWNMQCKTMGYCFRDIHTIGAGYQRVKGYCKADFNIPEASTITEVKTMKEPGLSYRCSGLLFQNDCTDHKSNTINKLHNTSSTCQNYRGSNYTTKFHDNRNNGSMLPTGTLSFQTSQHIKSGIDLSHN